MDSSITKTQKRNLTDMQEKFLDVLFGEAKGNPREAARIAGYSEHSYPKVIRNLKKEITELAETHLSTHSAKAATRLTDLLDEDGTTPHSNIRLAAANSILDRVGITKKDQLDINNFFSFLAAMMLAYQPVRSLATINMAINQGLSAAKRILPLIEQENKIKSQVLKCAPGAIAETKRLIEATQSKPIKDFINLASENFSSQLNTEGKEGILSFLEKRKPNWN